jgi:hypothetical protein
MHRVHGGICAVAFDYRTDARSSVHMHQATTCHILCGGSICALLALGCVSICVLLSIRLWQRVWLLLLSWCHVWVLCV